MKFSGFDLGGKVAVLVGAGGGIGQTLALGLAAAGSDIVVSDLCMSELESLAHEIRAMGRRTLAQRTDITKLSDIQALADVTLAEFGRIDILVNSAGVNIVESALDVSEEHWDYILDVNLKGFFFCSQIIGRVMINQGKGKIINISSVLGLVGLEKRVPYACSKGGITQMTKVLAIEWAPYRVNVNAIAPAITRTPMVEKLLQHPEWRQDVIAKSPAGRVCEPDDLIGAAVYLASDASDMLTGVTLPVDGGWTAW